jgi:uncharacterized hydrophobic protein (TIGR00271 family)
MDGTDQPPADTTAVDRPEEFQDYQGDVMTELGQFRWSELTSPESIRAIAALIGGILLLGWPDPSARVTAVLIGIGLIVVTVVDLVQRRGPSARERAPVLWSFVLLSLGIALIAWPGATGERVGRLIGAGIIIAGLIAVTRGLRGRTTDSGWQVTKGLLAISLGLVTALVPKIMLEAVVTVVILVWVGGGVITITNNLRSEKTIEFSGAWEKFTEWLEGRPHTADDRTQLYGKLFYEGPLAERRLSRFFILMGFATALATYGVIADSTAVVIGAMLIAPLMTPLMATSVSLIMGWPRRTAISALVALGGILFAIGLAILIGAGLPFDLPVTNSQVASRINPTLIDLAIAIAAGGAGAFALSRPDVSDALPGVAVAIALVPPLAVIGLMIGEGEGEAAVGASLLFTTNLVAILLTGAVVFVLTGVAPLSQLFQNRKWIRTSLGLVAALALVILAVLALSGDRILTESFDRTEAQEAVDAWLGSDSDLKSFEVIVGRSGVSVIVVGPNEPPSIDELGALLESGLGRSVDVTVNWIPEEQFVLEAED